MRFLSRCEDQPRASGIQPPPQRYVHIVYVIALAPQMLNLVNDQKLDAQASNEFVDAHTKHLFCPGTPVGVMHLEQDILEYRFERSLLVEPDNEMGWLPPSLTTSRCASVVLVQAKIGRAHV